MIPLPRPWLLAAALLIGTAVGFLVGVACTVLLRGSLRADVVAIALVLGIPSVIGLVTVLFSGRRWVTTVGAFILALAPGWFGVLVVSQVISGG